jgi:hypothetical protein
LFLFSFFLPLFSPIELIDILFSSISIIEGKNPIGIEAEATSESETEVKPESILLIEFFFSFKEQVKHSFEIFSILIISKKIL